MARKSKFIPKNTDKGWMINVPPKFTASGKRERHFYPTRDAAQAAARKLKEDQEVFGDRTISISPTLADQATQAEGMLAPFNISVLDAARRIVAIETRAMMSRAIEDAVAEFLTTKDKSAPLHFKAYKYAGDALVADFGGRMISTIGGAELKEHVEKRTGGNVTHNLRLRLLKALWRWCARPPRKWCDTEAVDHLDRKEVIPKGIGVLTAKQAKALMLTAEREYPECVPAFAIALFTGMRKQEIERLQPSDITAEGIAVPATSAKTKRRRYIHMDPALRDWLAAYPIGETVIPPNWQKKEKAVRNLAGWRVWCPLIKDENGVIIKPDESLPEWPDNALRHTSATVALALGKPIERLVFEHGHSGGLTTLQRHYIGVMPRSEAEKIYAIRPLLRKG